MAISSNSAGGAQGAVDERTGSQPDPNQIAKAAHQNQIVLNEHTSQLQKLHAKINRLIEKNNLNI